MNITSPFSEKVEELAAMIDEAIIATDVVRQEELLEIAIDMLEEESLWPKAKLYYCMAAIYSAQGDAGALDKDASIRKQLYSFRQSLILIENEDNDDMIDNPHIVAFSINLYINYASVLSVCGRRIDAIRYYKKALAIDETYGMALGNLGISYRDYSFLEYDMGHQEYFRYFSFHCLEEALKCENPNTYDAAKDRFGKLAEEYGNDYEGDYLIKSIESYEIEYEEEKEQDYRIWGIEHGFFLNTMNDLPVVSLMFANDMLHLPSMIVDIDAKPVFHGLYNQIKQEYAYSRYLYYCATDINPTVHFADKETHLKQFYDYPKYSISVEQLKTSFKTLYGIFDKVAFFINSYFDLGIKENDVSFKSIWFKSYGSKANKYDYKNVLNHKDNFALSALYWISRDFYERFEDSPNPELKRISQIRNALEHRYVKIVEDWFPERMSVEYDDLALYVSEKLIFLTSERKAFEERAITYEYFPGFAVSQKQKCIASLHKEIKRKYLGKKVLEISTKSTDPVGVKLSAFNLKFWHEELQEYRNIENVFQSSKVFEGGGPYRDLLDVHPRTAKRDERLTSSGKLKCFELYGTVWDLEPKTMFYDWLYINALMKEPELCEAILEYDIFTDIEFNSNRSINCQARSAAIYVSLVRNGKLEEALSDKEEFKRVY